MKRMVYLCKLLGNGTRGNEYRPACDAYPCAWRAFTWLEATGQPRYAWTLAVVDAVDHAPIAADNRCMAFDYAFDSLYADVPQSIRNKLVNFLTGESVSTAFLTNVVTVLEVWLHLGKLLDKNFSSAMLGGEYARDEVRA